MNDKRMREHNRKRYYDRIEKGLCTYCGVNKPVKGLRICEGCQTKKKTWNSSVIKWKKQEGGIYASKL